MMVRLIGPTGMERSNPLMKPVSAASRIGCESSILRKYFCGAGIFGSAASRGADGARENFLCADINRSLLRTGKSALRSMGDVSVHAQPQLRLLIDLAF